MVIAPPAPAASPEPDLHPSKWWYWLGGLLALAGILGAITLAVVGVNRYRDTIEGFGRFVAPGRAEVTFKESGEYTIYYEYQAQVDGTVIDAPSDPPVGLEIRLEGPEGPVTIIEEEFDEVYEIPDFHGQAVGRVDIDPPGPYIMEVDSADGGTFAMAIGKGALRSLLPWIAGALASLLGGLLIGGTILVVTAIRRSRNKQRRQDAQALHGQLTYGQPLPAPVVASAPPSWAEPPRPAGSWAPPSRGGPLPPPAQPPAGSPPWGPPAAPPSG